MQKKKKKMQKKKKKIQKKKIQEGAMHPLNNLYVHICTHIACMYS